MAWIRTMAATCAALLTASTLANAQVLIADEFDEHGNFVGATTETNPLAGSPLAKVLHARPTATTGVRNVAVIPVQFGATPLPFTEAELDALHFGSVDSVDTHLQESTYGRTWLSGHVTSPVSITASTATCDYNDYATKANAALATREDAVRGDGADGFHHYVYFFPNVAACGWAGLAQVPGRRVWINGYMSRSVISHELGHNLGLGHANVLQCEDGGTPKQISSTCTSNEYADPFENMGLAGRQFSGVSRQLIGALDPSQTALVTTSQTVTLESSSVPGAGVRSIEIPRAGTSDVWFVEMRSTAGYDTFPSGSNVTQGVLIRKRTEEPYFMTDTDLIDANPQTTTPNDAAFVPGQSFTDPTGKITIAVLSRSGNTASVKVTFGVTTTTTEPVSVTTSPLVAAKWPSRVMLYRRPDGLLQVAVRRTTSLGATCSYRVRATRLSTGGCLRLTSSPAGWRMSRAVRSGDYLTVTMVAAGTVVLSKKVRAPRTRGKYLFYRLK